MGCISRHDLDAGMRGLDCVDCCIDGLRARILERRAKRHDHNGIFILQVGQVLVLIRQDTDLRGRLQSHRRILDFRVQLIRSFCSRIVEAGYCRTEKTCCQ